MRLNIGVQPTTASPIEDIIRTWRNAFVVFGLGCVASAILSWRARRRPGRLAESS